MSGCASPERLKQFLSGDIDGAEIETILDHLDHCALCRAVLETETGHSASAGESALHSAADEWTARLLARVRDRGRISLVPDVTGDRAVDRAEPRSQIFDQAPGAAPHEG